MHLLCKCGENMWNGNIPNDIEYWVYSDKQSDKILENDIISTLELGMSYDYNVWRCPKCNRLYVFENGRNEVIAVYKLEDN